MINQINTLSFGKLNKKYSQGKFYIKPMPYDVVQLNIKSKNQVRINSIYKELLDNDVDKKVAKSIIKDKKLLEKYLLYTSPEIDNSGNLKSGLTRVLKPEEAANITLLKSDINLAHLYIFSARVFEDYYEYPPERAVLIAKEFIEKENITENFEKLVSQEVDENGNLKSGLKRTFENSEAVIFLAALNMEEAQKYLDFEEEYGLDLSIYLLSSEEHYNKIFPLINGEKDEEGNLKSGLKRVLNVDEVISVINNNIEKERLEEFVELVDSTNSSLNEIGRIFQDERTYEKYKLLISDEKDENNELKSGLLNKLSKDEAISFIMAGYEIDEINACLILSKCETLEEDEIYLFIENKEKLKELLSLVFVEMEDDGTIKFGLKRSLSPEEAVAVIINGYSSSMEKVNEIISIIDTYGLSAQEAMIVFENENQEVFYNLISKMTPKQAIKVIEYNIEDEKIPNFLKLLDDEEDENGKLKSGFARPLTEEEAAYILDLTEAGEVLDSPITRVHINRFIELVDSYISFEDAESLIIDDEKFNRYLDLRTEKEDLTPQEVFSVVINEIKNEHIYEFLLLSNQSEYDNGESISGLSEPISEEQAKALVEANVLSTDLIELFIKLQRETNITIQQAVDIISKPEKLEKFKLFTSTETDENGKLKSQLNIPLTKEEAADILINVSNEEELKECLRLINEEFYLPSSAVFIVNEKQEAQRCLEYTSVEKDGNGNLKTGLKRPLLKPEALALMGVILNTDEVNAYIDMLDADISQDIIMEVIRNDEILSTIMFYTSSEQEEDGSLFSGLSRPLTIKEAVKMLTLDFKLPDEIKKMAELIALGFPIAKAEILAKQFYMYKNVKSIDELSYSQKKDLLEKLVKNNTELFYKNNTSLFEIIPTNQKQYCETLSVLSSSVMATSKSVGSSDSIDKLIDVLKTGDIDTDKEKINGILEEIFVQIPEYKNVMKRKRFRALSKLVNANNFDELSLQDKQTSIIALLIIESKKRVISAFNFTEIINKFNFNDEQKLKLYKLISMGNWASDIKKLEKQGIYADLKNIAFEFRHSNLFDLSKMVLKAINEDENLDSTIDMYSEKIESEIRTFKKTQIFLPQTKVPKASEMKNVQTKTANGITNKVLYMKDVDSDLSIYGFEDGTTLQNWHVLIHALEKEKQFQTFNMFSFIDSDAIVSSSYISPEEYKVYRKQGIILDVDSSNIHAGYYRDFGSGFIKDMNLLKEKYFRPSSKEHIYRSYISDLVKDKLNIDDDEYIAYIKEIDGCKTITEVEKIAPELAEALLQIFEEMDFGKRTFGRQYNEMLVSCPKIQGVFSYDQKYEDIPIFLRKFAQDNDLPVIMFGETEN